MRTHYELNEEYELMPASKPLYSFTSFYSYPHRQKGQGYEPLSGDRAVGPGHPKL